MKCPVDATPLIRQTVSNGSYPDIHLDHCEVCHGVWVNATELAPLLRSFSADSEKTYELWLKASHSGVTEPKDFWQETARLCPHDGAVLRRYYTPSAHKVGIEQCTACHGFWFDGSELYAVAKANEPNPQLDAAIAGAARGLRSELGNNYDDTTVDMWDIISDPRHLVPHIQDILFTIMAAKLVKK